MKDTHFLFHALFLLDLSLYEDIRNFPHWFTPNSTSIFHISTARKVVHTEAARN